MVLKVGLRDRNFGLNWGVMFFMWFLRPLPLPSDPVALSPVFSQDRPFLSFKKDAHILVRQDHEVNPDYVRLYQIMSDYSYFKRKVKIISMNLFNDNSSVSGNQYFLKNFFISFSLIFYWH